MEVAVAVAVGDPHPALEGKGLPEVKSYTEREGLKCSEAIRRHVDEALKAKRS